MATFARNAATLLQRFHQEVDSRARQVGAGIAGLGMLQQQLGVYEAILKDESESAKTKINNTQKDINREFIPVIAAAMAPAYTTCVQECGKLNPNYHKSLADCFRDWKLYAHEGRDDPSRRPGALLNVSAKRRRS